MPSPAIDYDALAAQHGGGVDYDALASQHGGTEDKSSSVQEPSSSASRLVSNYWQQVNPVAQYKALGDTLSKIVTHPLQTLTDIGTANDAPRVAAADAFKRGDYVEGVRHGVNWLLNAVPGVGSTMENASDKAQSGDVAGGVGTMLGVATNLAVLPKLGGKILDVATEPDALQNAATAVKEGAETVGTATKGAAQGAFQGATGLHRRFGVPVPDVATGAAVGGAAARAVGLPHELGAAVGATAPIVKGAYSGIREALATLATKRAAAAQEAADAIRSMATPEVAEEAASGPLTIPESRQLPPASQTQVGPANAIAGGADTIQYQPPTIPAGASGPIPTDPVTGRPMDRTYPVENATLDAQVPELQAASAQTPPVDPQERVSLDDIAKGIAGRKFSELSKQQQEFAQRAYDEIHAEITAKATGDTAVGTSDNPAVGAVPYSGNQEEVSTVSGNSPNGPHGDAAGITTEPQAVSNNLDDELQPSILRRSDTASVGVAPSLSPRQQVSVRYSARSPGPSISQTSAPSASEPLGNSDNQKPYEASGSGIQGIFSSDKGVPRETSLEPTTEKPSLPEPKSTVVSVPARGEMAPAKLMSEEGLAQYSKDNGLTEDDARQSLTGEGYQIIGRSALNRALHGIGTELDMNHDILSDVAKIQFRVKSMSQLSQEDMLQLYKDLQERRAVNNPMLGKGELGSQFRGETPKPSTDYTSSAQVGPQPPALKRPTDFGDQLRQSAEASLAKRAPQAVGPAKALQEALEKPETVQSATPETPKNFPLINVGDRVQLRNGKTVTVKRVNPDQTFEWK